MRTIAVFTGTRAEYGLLHNVMAEIIEKEGCLLQVVVSGSHLDARLGMTIGEILADAIPVHATPEIATASATRIGTCTSMGLGLIRYADVLEKMHPDLLLLLGDRFESFAMAAAATVMRIPIAHIGGGETTEGAIDEAFRHSMTKMSHLHFTSCETYKNRVIQMGEEPERVFNVGALGVENALTRTLLEEAEIRAELGLDSDQPYLLCTFHPETLNLTLPAEQIEQIFVALGALPDHAVVFTGANADAGGTEINAIIQDRVAQNSRFRFFMSLGQKRYFSAVKHAVCVFGNSSSGIIEVPSFHIPVVDIGDRQKGRVRAESVLHAMNDPDSIRAALTRALSEEQRYFSAQAVNPYDQPGTARRIVEMISSWSLQGILQKHFYSSTSL